MIRDLFIPGVPVAKGRPRFRRNGAYVIAYTPKKTHEAENTIAQAWKNAYGRLTLMEGPLELSIVAYMPLPKGASKKRLLAVSSSGEWHLVKPDSSNLGKLVEDALNGVAYADDSIVCVSAPIKVYAATTPGVYIRLRELDETPNDYLAARGLPIQP